MSPAEVVTAFIAAFFVIGVVVGIIAVVAMSAVRTDRGRRDGPRRGPHRPGRNAAADGNAIGWEEPPGPGEEGEPPRWPGGFTG